MVFLVGAGPGDPALLTRRGADLLARADVVVFDGLVNAVLLDLAPPAAERVYAGKKHADLGPAMTQEAINELLIARARAGNTVVRLKGGDAFVFGRGAEEGRALAAAGVPFEIVPGVTAATAVPAYAGIPLTARGIASTVAFATGHEAAGKPASAVDWQGLARAETIVLFMALRTAGECARNLIEAGRAATTPAAAIHWGTTAAQRTIVTTLGELGADVDAAGLKPPVLLVIGDVVGERDVLSWYERRPLFGARVLIPRPIEQSRRFADELASLGGEPVFAPVTRIAPPDDPEPLRAALRDLEEFAWVVLTSANAVRALFAELAALGLDARALGLAKVACVGPVTAAELAHHGVRADVVPAHGDAVATAAAVLEAAGGEIRQARVLLPRAQHGRDEAADALREAGADVEVAAAYKNEPTPADDPSVQFGLRRLRRGRIDCVAFFAPSQVGALCDLVGDGAEAVINGCAVVAAIGATTARALTQRGIRVDLIPSAPDAEVLARELAAAFAAKRGNA